MSLFFKFFQLEAASGILLAICTALALIFANTTEAYLHILDFSLFGLTLHHWINDGLMTIFFFAVGMEIKRELVVGELSSFKKAALPILAAVGGMIFPAFIYLAFNPGSSGWGIPMATDIAFAVSVLSFFGKRVPFALKVFLLALAIVDDLGAVLVIALFYTEQIAFVQLLLAAVAFSFIYLARRMNFRCYGTYLFLGAAAWYFFLRSGVHATVAGVILGFLTPLALPPENGRMERPLDQLLEMLHPVVNFFIMPLFALANAGVELGEGGAVVGSVSVGVMAGLVLGKPVGILALCAAGRAFGFMLPKHSTWPQLAGVGLLGGIGFTMALFISGLALPGDLQSQAKAGILLGSLVAASLGGLVLQFTLPRGQDE